MSEHHPNPPSSMPPPPPPMGPPPSMGPPPVGPPPMGTLGAISPLGIYWKDAALRGRIVGGTYCGLGFLLFISAFLPFASFFGRSAPGIDGDGIFTLALGLFAIGIGVVRFLGIHPGLIQLGWTGVGLTTFGLTVVIAFSIMLSVGDAGAGVGVGLIFTMLLGLAGTCLAGADLVMQHGEIRRMPTHPTEPVFILAFGILSLIGLAAFGPAAAAMAGLTLQRSAQRPPAAPGTADPSRNLVSAGLICGAIGTLWLMIFSIAVIANA